MRAKLTWLVLAVFLVVAGFVVSAQHAPTSAAAGGAMPAIVVAAPRPPADIPGGAKNASIQQAAAFAWQEFIALNWPAVAQTGGVNQRDTPDSSCAFGDPKCAGRPRVWETYRGKVEIFPGDGNPPPGYATPPANVPTPLPSQTPRWSYGYDALPRYDYDSADLPSPCPNTTAPPVPAWINLDETDEITLAAMYSGNGPTSAPGNVDPQLVRFLAKANRTEYVYVARHPNWWLGPGGAPVGAPTSVPSGQPTPTGNYVVEHGGDPPANSDQYVSFPYGTIEVKAGWRLLGQKDEATRFHVQRVRYYEPNPNANGAPSCFREAQFGLVALHIIQKTPSAPFFIYASFEQADNIRTPDGHPVEADDGALLASAKNICPSGQMFPCPMTPRTLFVDAPSPKPNSGGVPPQVVLQPPNAPYCSADLKHRPPNQLYYLNEIGKTPQGGFICVNHRAQLIPREIVAVNDAAQSAIRTYLAQHGFKNEPWPHYKLVNVQYYPVDKTYAAHFNGIDPKKGPNPNTYDNAESYYLANSVVETNTVLQTFSGGLTPYVRSDYQYHFWFFAPPPRPTPPPALTATHKQVYFGGTGHDMGGCMGCHGSQGQDQGGDFSVIMARGTVQPPEFPQSAAVTAALAPGPRALFAAQPRKKVYNRHLVPDQVAPISAH